jgi:DNA replication and repair protein RecF
LAKITQLSLENFRNIDQAWLNLAPKLNLVVGDNAAGKTALIEAIWLLSTGRSFRTAKPHQLIQHQAEQLTLFCKIEQQNTSHQLGMQRSEQTQRIKLNGEPIYAQSQLAHKLPVQLLTPESHRLLEEGPKSRRSFLDWGCFYQKTDFAHLWKTHQHILKQRNHALRQKLPQNQATLWDHQLIQVAQQIHQIREAYLQELAPYLAEFCTSLMPEVLANIKISYRSGWPKNTEDLALLFKQHYAKDALQGFTQYGCHRADLRFYFDEKEALIALSRGQQKLFVCSLLLAQSALYEKYHQEPVIMLIDDLPAELDQSHRLTLLKLLDCLNIQHIITTTEASLIPILSTETHQTFKIKDGIILSP